MRYELSRQLRVPPGYKRLGCWFVPEEVSPLDGGGRWLAWRETAAGRGILLPPDQNTALAVPGEMGWSEQKRWNEVVDGWPI